MIFSSKSQMIHVVSEVVVLIGFTFYFTSKINKLSDDLVKTNQIIKSQNERINYLESMVKHILNKINKPVKIEEPYQNRQPNQNKQPILVTQETPKEAIHSVFIPKAWASLWNP